MHPVYDVDSLLILATALSSKRRPAELVEIVSAADLLQNNIPNEAKLVEAFDRLARSGLIKAEGGGFVLTAVAQEIVTGLPRKAENPERLFAIKDRLSEYNIKGEHAGVTVDPADVTAAILAHRASEKTTAKNLLVPKPKPEAAKARPGQRQRKPLPKSRQR